MLIAFVSMIALIDYSIGAFYSYLGFGNLSLDEILSSEDLIPNIEELSDPIGWAARTSMPPI